MKIILVLAIIVAAVGAVAYGNYMLGAVGAIKEGWREAARARGAAPSS